MKLFYSIILILLSLSLFSQDLTLLSEDTYIEKIEGEEGLHLYIRAKPDIKSVILTDSTEDPEDERSVFALRDFDYNETVSNETRILDGTELDKSYNFLIDSTPEENELFGSAYHIYLPRGVSYGWPWSREGQIDIGEGSWLNIRTLALPYGEHGQGFEDNPFVVRLYEEYEPIEEEKEETIFEEIARETDGDYSEEFDGDGAVKKIGEILDEYEGEDVDLALVVDTTISMKDDVEFVRQKLIPLVKDKVKGFKSVRIAVVLYRDYKEAYLTRRFDFVDNFDKVQMILDSIKVAGGRDIPEAVFEAIYDAQTQLEWSDSEKIIVQVGDAPPHPEPRGDVTSDMVYETSKELGISIYPILLMDEKRAKSKV